MSEPENPYGLPPEVFASLRPVGGGELLDVGRLHEIAVSNYRTSLPHERAYRARLCGRIRTHVFEQAWEATGGDWSFRRANLAAYKDFEVNFKQAGRV